MQRHLSGKQKRSKNRKKAIKRLARDYLTVSRQRKDFACKQASALVKSSDFLAYEDLKIASLVKITILLRVSATPVGACSSPHVRDSGTLHGIPVIAVSPRYTTQECSECGLRVQKTLSVRTHICPRCGLVLDRDWNAALNILLAAQPGQLHTVPPGRRKWVPLRRDEATSGQKISSGHKRLRPVKSAG